nr:hypothetical protein [Tanacetum cinerariifolium]
MMGDVSDQKVPKPNLTITRVLNQEKSPDLLSHLGFKAIQPSAECPIIINGKNIPLLDFIRLGWGFVLGKVGEGRGVDGRAVGSSRSRGKWGRNVWRENWLRVNSAFKNLQGACLCWGEVEKNIRSRVGGGERQEKRRNK